MTATIGTDWLGRIIDGRYVVEGVLGSGGMGVVLAARHKFTRARVAVKMVRTDLGIDAEIEARFLSEARVPTAIDHRGVVKTLDAGKTAEGELYIVMELLGGRSLRDQITSGLGGPTTRRIGMELLDVLAAAHARGIIHRDVKPENVFLVEPDLSVKLLDFGITKVLAGTASVLPRTAAGAMLGTLAYMAPEQLVDASSVDARADLWSVAVILYEMMSGRRPHRATTFEDMLGALMNAPDPIRVALPSATPDVEAFFVRALAREPQRRFASAPEMAVAFAQLPLSASPPPVVRPAGGNLTVATGFAATVATPERGAPSVVAPSALAPSAVLTPFAGTRALVLPGPGQAAPPAAVPPAPNRGFAIPATPSLAAAPAPVPPAPGRGFAIPATPSLAAAPARAPTGTGAMVAVPTRRRFAWVLGGVSTLALAAAIVIAVGSARHRTAPSPVQGDVALPSPASPRSPEPAAPDPAPAAPDPAPAAPDPAPAAPDPAPVAPDPAPAAPDPAPPRFPAALPKPAEPARPALPPSRAGAAQPKVRPPDPHPGTTPSALPRRDASPPPPPPRRDATPTSPASPPPPPRRDATPTSSASPQTPPRRDATPTPPASTQAPPRRDATPTPSRRDATPTPAEPAKPGAPVPPPALRSAELCAAGCKMLASCHLGSQTCEADCAKHGTLNSCLLAAPDSCNRFAACWFAASCHGVAPKGERSCSAAIDCETACNGNTACICGCVRDVSINHAAALLGYNGCALGCKDARCVAKQCRSQTRACRAE